MTDKKSRKKPDLSGKKIYIAGKISGDKHYKRKFKKAERILRRLGATIMNPSVLPLGFPHSSYMPICIAMIDACDSVYLLPDWTMSQGAKMECNYACKQKMTLIMNRNKEFIILD